MRKQFKKVFFIGVILSVAGIALIVFCNWRIEAYSKKYVFGQLDSVPSCKVALVLGTIKKLSNGQPNLFFRYRMNAVTDLYKAGKIKYIIVSGDNSREGYNEPEDMKQSLIDRGIPENVIYEDFAGFRTFDSVIRAKEVFGQNKYIVVSQAFHNERAVYIARTFGIEAYGYNAQTLSLESGFKTYFRERFSRAKVFLDLLTGKQPKFLGKQIVIPD